MLMRIHIHTHIHLDLTTARRRTQKGKLVNVHNNTRILRNPECE